MVEHITANPLEPYIGPSVLVDVSDGNGAQITGSELSEKLEPIFVQMRPVSDVFPPRLILQTKTRQGTFRYLTPDAVEYLFAIAIALIDTDAPAMDPPGTEERLIEGLLKRNVTVGLVGLELEQFYGIEPYMLLAAPVLLGENTVGPQPTRALLVKVPGF